ncbi:MAG: FadR/GntR family transcriptional regulator, partial [Hyphomicrobiales bacterium]
DAGFFADKEVTKTVRVVVEGLLSRIRAQEYPPGSRLPAERHLASEFGVARNTVREALDLLEAHQIISRRAGSGSFITHRPQEGSSEAPDLHALNGAVSEATSPLELQVVRGIIEPEMIRLAVINMAPRDIGELRATLERMEAIQTDPEAYARAEEEFHMQIARGTENPLLIAIYALIIDVRRQAHWAAQRRKTLSPNRIREYQRRHRSLFEAIELRDIESAAEYVKLQLVDEQRALMREG